MRIYGITNLYNGRYSSFQQISTNPDNLDWFVEGYIVWYKDWDNEDSLDMQYYDIVDIQERGWKIWKSTARIFNCSYTNNIISQVGKGVLEIVYKEGELIELKYWFNEKDYAKHNNPDLIKR